MLRCYASTLSLSPQLFLTGDAMSGQSIKVWDLYNVLGPPSPPPPPQMIFNANNAVEWEVPRGHIDPNGKLQARAISIFLNSLGVRFNLLYSSPLDRALSMAVLVCQLAEEGRGH
ncbi:hypothetical protein FEM48_Zijuj08G0121800 [Ziziphus jujuba var. spinosa]|uniref:Uncharacterized protein n=1 Tax=Ziziphus jujuba var. spinosa TaxID=714518 RepID=A0A978UZ10_ZIZJJ|nr:hypothetical protein FEM48_Zijuj08G0121800 [Ziziphus jujuba var. spinosa]